MSGRVFCLDFDGVLVDSAREVGLAGYKTLHAIDSVAFGADAPEAALSAFVLARPVLETGWEAVLMLWLIESGASPADLLRDFQTVGKARALEKLGGQDAVMAAFHEARQGWIHADRQGWLAAHEFYGTAVDAVKNLVLRGEVVFIITTKSAEFAVELLEHAGLSVPASRVFGLGSGKKHAVLEQVLRQTGAQDAIFVEDRLKTLEQVQECGTELVQSRTRLLLAAWGYNTAEQRARAVALGLQVVSEDEFAKALDP